LGQHIISDANKTCEAVHQRSSLLTALLARPTIVWLATQSDAGELRYAAGKQAIPFYAA
jgi:hypothetical protein